MPAGSAASCGPGWHAPGRALRLLDTVSPADLTDAEEAFVGSVTDGDLVRRAVAGADAVVHLAGIPTEGPWADILDVNVTGSQTVLHAAAEAGVRTVVVASSNHAAGFWERPTDGSLLPDDVAPGPDSYYGWSKAAVETPRPAVPRAVRPDRGEPEDRLVLAASVRPARRRDLALPRRRRTAGRGGDPRRR